MKKKAKKAKMFKPDLDINLTPKSGGGILSGGCKDLGRVKGVIKDLRRRQWGMEVESRGE